MQTIQRQHGGEFLAVGDTGGIGNAHLPQIGKIGGGGDDSAIDGGNLPVVGGQCGGHQHPARDGDYEGDDFQGRASHAAGCSSAPACSHSDQRPPRAPTQGSAPGHRLRPAHWALEGARGPALTPLRVPAPWARARGDLGVDLLGFPLATGPPSAVAKASGQRAPGPKVPKSLTDKTRKMALLLGQPDVDSLLRLPPSRPRPSPTSSK